MALCIKSCHDATHVNTCSVKLACASSIGSAADCIGHDMPACSKACWYGHIKLTWRVQHIQDEGSTDKADEARHNASQGPGTPRDGLPKGFRGQVDSQRVGSHSCDEHSR